AEAAHAALARRADEVVKEELAEALALVIVGDRDRDLGHLGLVAQADEARDADAVPVAAVGGRHAAEREVVLAVDLGEVAQVRLREVLARREEAPVARLG